MADLLSSISNGVDWWSVWCLTYSILNGICLSLKMVSDMLPQLTCGAMCASLSAGKAVSLCQNRSGSVPFQESFSHCLGKLCAKNVTIFQKKCLPPVEKFGTPGSLSMIRALVIFQITQQNWEHNPQQIPLLWWCLKLNTQQMSTFLPFPAYHSLKMNQPFLATNFSLLQSRGETASRFWSSWWRWLGCGCAEALGSREEGPEVGFDHHEMVGKWPGKLTVGHGFCNGIWPRKMVIYWDLMGFTLW